MMQHAASTLFRIPQAQIDGWDCAATFLYRADIARAKKFKEVPLGTVWAWTWAEQFPDDPQAAINEGAGFVQFFEPDAAQYTHCAQAERWCVVWANILDVINKVRHLHPSHRAYGMVVLIMDYLYSGEHEVEFQTLEARLQAACIALEHDGAV